MNKNKIKNERRQSVRFRIFSLVKRAANPDVVTFKVEHIQNISRGGVAFFADEELKENAILKLYFLPPNRMKPIEACGKVVRCPKVFKSAKPFEVGIQFLDISEDGKLAIQELELFFLEEQKKIRA